MEQNIRWKQRFSNFEKAFGQLSEFIELLYSVDISIMRQIENPELIDHINRVGIQFYLKSN